MQKTIPRLVEEMQLLGLEFRDLDLSSKGVKKEVLKRLERHFLRERYGEAVPRNIERRLQIESPMLCFRFSDLKEKEQEEVLHSEEWVAEEKFNGVRALAFYDEGEGLKFFSRHISSEDYLPIDVTHAVRFPFEGALASGENLKISGVENFILDCELTCSEDDIGLGSEQTKSRLGSMVALANSSPARAEEVFEGHQRAIVTVNVFDLLLWDGEEFKKEPLLRRCVKLKRLFEKVLYFSPVFSRVQATPSGKARLFEEVTAGGGEGIVLKNIESSYNATSGRWRRGWVKLKRSMSGFESEQPKIPDLDVWVGGFSLGTVGKRHEGKVGTVHLFTYLVKTSGQREPYHVASVSGMPDALRDEMTRDFERFRSRVLTVDGMSVSPKNYRIAHAVVEWDSCWRADKGPEDCEMLEETLMENIL